MLIDSNCILKEGAISATGTGSTVKFGSFAMPGRAEPIPFVFRVTETFTGGTSIAFKLQQSADNTSWSDVDGTAFTVAAAKLVKGARMGTRFLSGAAEKPYLRLAWTVTGTFTTGKIFAAFAREDDLPMTDALKFDGTSKPASAVTCPESVTLTLAAKKVTSGTATALGAGTAVIASNQPAATKYRVALSASSGTLSAVNLALDEVADLNTALAALTITTAAASTVTISVFNADAECVAVGLLAITI